MGTVGWEKLRKDGSKVGRDIGYWEGRNDSRKGGMEI